MKTISLAFLTILTTAALVQSKEQSPIDSAEAVIAPTSARIIGEIPDGTPPPPAPPKIPFVVPSQDVLSTTAHEQDGRIITVQRIKPIALPPPPEAPPLPVADSDPATLQRLAEFQQTHRDSDILLLGATIYRFKDSPTRTLVNFWPSGTGEQVSFWSSADFALLSGVSNFIATDGQTHSLFLIWSVEEIDIATRDPDAPGIPDFPDGKATFTIVGKVPDAETLVPIQSLHDLYNSDHERLKIAWEGRERARLQHEAELKANPPQPKNLTLNYWEIGTDALQNGGAR